MLAIRAIRQQSRDMNAAHRIVSDLENAGLGLRRETERGDQGRGVLVARRQVAERRRERAKVDAAVLQVDLSDRSEQSVPAPRPQPSCLSQLPGRRNAL